MSDEHFLSRWSRRKQEKKGDHAEPPLERTAADADGSAPPGCAAADQVLSESELSDLPPIESIDAATDITAFLRKGIPQELSRAALRRAWSADPAIRDFVGLAENAWDFNDPTAMPGFGPLDYSAEQVEALVRRIIDGVVDTTESVVDPLAKTAEVAVRLTDAGAASARSSNSAEAITDPQQFGEFAAAELPSNSADGLEPQDANEETSLPRRTHGGALPH